MDRGAWWATVHGITKSWPRLSDMHTQLYNIRCVYVCQGYSVSEILIAPVA